MTIPVRPEWPTAALRSSQATHAVVDNSAPSPTGPSSTYKSGEVVQTPGASSLIIYPKTKIIGVNLATKFEYCVLAVAIATSLTLIGFVLWCARYGLDLTDEGFFLIWVTIQVNIAVVNRTVKADTSWHARIA